MKKTLMIMMVMAVLLIATIATLAALPALPRDQNNNLMQFHRSFTVEHDSCNAITIHRATVPDKAVEALLIVKTAPILIASDSTLAITDDVLIPVGVPVRIPVTKMTKFYYRSATATASILDIIWFKD